MDVSVGCWLLVYVCMVGCVRRWLVSWMYVLVGGCWLIVSVGG